MMFLVVIFVVGKSALQKTVMIGAIIKRLYNIGPTDGVLIHDCEEVIRKK